MKCFVCGEKDWHKLPGLHSQSLIQVCKKCGLLCHEVDVAKEKELKEYYRKNYKPVLGTPAIITAGNKLHYIDRFLSEYLQDKKGLMCADIGAATGYVLNYLRQRGHKVTGCEWVVNNRRLSEHFYGIPLTEELSKSQKYDFLSMYHVIEHLMEPEVKLKKYVDMLNDDGRFMISAPKWLGMLQEESGSPLRDGAKDTAQKSFDNLFHKDHINLFTPKSLRNLFNQAGLTVVKENLETYGQTYLLKKGEVKPIEPEDYQAITEKVLLQKKAIELYYRNQFQDAVKVWPTFPEAWVALIFGVYGKDPERQDDIIKGMNEEARSSWRFMCAHAQWLARVERLDEALALADLVLQKRMIVDVIYFMAECLTRQGKHRQAMDTFHKVAQLQPHRWQDCYQWIIHNATKLPTWDERAEAGLLAALADKARGEGLLHTNEPGPVGAP